VFFITKKDILFILSYDIIQVSRGGDIVERLANFFNEHPKSRILDVGTGSGNFIELIRQLYADYEEIIGIDTLEYAVTTAKKHFSSDEKIRFFVMDAIHMNFEDETFDVVCLSNSLHHLHDINSIFNEMRRVLKPGGYILVSEMVSNDLNERQLSHLKLHHFAAEIDRYLGDVHNDTYSNQTVIDLLVQHSECTITDSWPMEFERKEDTSDEETEWLLKTVDRVVNRVIDPIKNAEFTAKGQEIKEYIKTVGFDSATTLIVVMKK